MQSPYQSLMKAELNRTLPHAIVAILLISASISAWAGQETVIDGMVHVRNGSQPIQGVRTLNLQEKWRIGGEDDDVLLGLITRVRADEEGNIYLLDAQLCEVLVYSPQGEHLKTLFREGEGPGEIQRPRDLVLFDDGVVGAAMEFPGKVILVDRQGSPAGTITVGGGDPTRGGFESLIMCDARAGTFVLAGTHISQGEAPGTQNRTNYLSSYSRDGEELVRLATGDATYDFNDFVFSESEHLPPFWWGVALGSDGSVYAATDRDRYEISVFAPDGTLKRVIEREFEPWKRTAAERRQMIAHLEAATAGTPLDVRIEIEDSEPSISYFHRGLRVADDGKLWVISSRSVRNQPDGVMLTYDVFDRAGHFVEQVAVACEGDPRVDGLFFVGENAVVLIKGYLDALASQFGRTTAYSDLDEEPAPMEVIYFTVASS